MATGHSSGNPLLDVEWEPCLLEKRRDRELESFARRALGAVPTAVFYLNSCPWLVRAHVLFNFTQGLLVHLDFRTAELISMAVSQESSCRYCYATSRFLLKMQGMSEQHVRKLEQQLTQTSNDTKLDAAIAFARRMTRSDPLVTEEDKERLLAAGYSNEELKEIAFVVAYTLVANRASTIPAVPPQEFERLPDSVPVRLLRPLLAFMLKQKIRHGKPAGPAPTSGRPFAYLIDAYEGSPIAHAISEVMGDAWESNILSRRCKALLFAVVAKGLDCPLSLRETEKILADTGLTPVSINNILDHLRSDELDEVEQLLVPFARQTIWYKPARVQRHARELLNCLSTEQFVEAVGILALANAFCRLGAAVLERK